MLFIKFGYFVSAALAVPVLLICMLILKKIYGKVHKTKLILFALLYISLSILLVNALLPFPYQKSVIAGGGHRVPNYFIPFSYCSFMYKSFANSHLSWVDFIVDYIQGNLRIVFLGFIIGFLTKSIFKIRKASNIFIPAITVIAIYLAQFLLGIVINTNYKSIITEQLFFYILFFCLGSAVYTSLIKFFWKHKDQSNILNFLVNHLST